MPRTGALKKEKKTYTLSKESVSYLENVKKQRRKSASEVLDDMIQEKRLEEEKARVDAAISAYYDCLTEEDREQNRAWGKFAETQVPID